MQADSVASIPTAEAELAIAASPVLAKIRGQRVPSNPRIEQMLAYIEAHLFDRDLSVSKLKRVCQIRDNSIAVTFHSLMGTAPGAYIANCKVEVARSLLADSQLPIWQISDLLGYSSIQVFSRAFFRRVGQRPSAFRKNSPNKLSEPICREEHLRQALSGELESPAAARLIRLLLDLYPPRAIEQRPD